MRLKSTESRVFKAGERHMLRITGYLE